MIRRGQPPSSDPAARKREAPEAVTEPILDEALYWRHEPGRHLMREAYDVQRDDIFIDFYDRIARAPASTEVGHR